MSRDGNVVIAQGGGPTAVINASLYGVVRESIRKLSAASKIWGARGGIEGVLRERWLDLRQPNEPLWKRIAQSPGAALGSCRKMLSAQEALEAVRPTVGQNQGQRSRPSAPFMNEMQPPAIDGREVVAKAVERRLLRAPLEPLAPVFNQFTKVAQVRAVFPPSIFR